MLLSPCQGVVSDNLVLMSPVMTVSGSLGASRGQICLQHPQAGQSIGQEPWALDTDGQVARPSVPGVVW